LIRTVLDYGVWPISQLKIFTCGNKAPNNQSICMVKYRTQKSTRHNNTTPVAFTQAMFLSPRPQPRSPTRVLLPGFIQTDPVRLVSFITALAQSIHPCSEERSDPVPAQINLPVLSLCMNPGACHLRNLIVHSHLDAHKSNLFFIVALKHFPLT
jgi:hypothetical protein